MIAKEYQQFCKYFILLFIVLITGCSQNNHYKKVENYIHELQSQPPQKIEPLPSIQPAQKFIYGASHLRDPFEPTISSAKNNRINQPDTKRPKQPLEAYPLDALRMVGNFSQGVQIWAIVRAPDGKIYRVGIGDYLGQDFGRIDSITKNKIILIETVPNLSSGWSERPAELTFSGNNDK